MRYLLRIVHALRRGYWWLVRPTTQGVRAIILDGAGRVFLVRHSYQDGWFLPGGKSRRGESDEAALERELSEEVGVVRPFTSVILGRYTNSFEFKKDFITVFVVTKAAPVDHSHFEIDSSGYFPINDLPPKTSPGTRRRIAEALQGAAITEAW